MSTDQQAGGIAARIGSTSTGTGPSCCKKAASEQMLPNGHDMSRYPES
jgi:hypothetical protein